MVGAEPAANESALSALVGVRPEDAIVMDLLMIRRAPPEVAVALELLWALCGVPKATDDDDTDATTVGLMTRAPLPPPGAWR